MSDTAQDSSETEYDNINARLPQIRVRRPYYVLDFATLLGLIIAIGLIFVAIFLGEAQAQFFNVRALVIVLFGTVAVTCISYTGEELSRAGSVIIKSIFPQKRDMRAMARQLLDIAVVARIRGPLALSQTQDELQNDPYLKEAVNMVVDGFDGQDIQRILGQELEAQMDRHARSAGILRRSSEIAPAMGLIGTLLGLVQMLAQLDDPSNIGPAMATALLTTFYGAILGTVVLAPLAAKLEKNSNDEALIKHLVIIAMKSLTDKENPRHLEIRLNSELPPDERIKYFK